ncbi:uncharacterized protein E0L32_001022 [Thyridium curvatum]|uniref:Uncharacterized protein n=1 Tax=Thyridium curvatum TaxID=1093900 RepID=A0A507AXM6_9PEZI|nr:uncharacterized protein E0L32_001022 [Thyridium curvatum]TPX11204.1 hypothetical protein E0L32_001022 [Thyridium curvatum]
MGYLDRSKQQAKGSSICYPKENAASYLRYLLSTVEVASNVAVVQSSQKNDLPPMSGRATSRPFPLARPPDFPPPPAPLGPLPPTLASLGTRATPPAPLRLEELGIAAGAGRGIHPGHDSGGVFCTTHRACSGSMYESSLRTPFPPPPPLPALDDDDDDEGGFGFGGSGLLRRSQLRQTWLPRKKLLACGLRHGSGGGGPSSPAPPSPQQDHPEPPLSLFFACSLAHFFCLSWTFSQTWCSVMLERNIFLWLGEKFLVVELTRAAVHELEILATIL